MFLARYPERACHTAHVSGVEGNLDTDFGHVGF